jgi:hypothetical protein
MQGFVLGMDLQVMCWCSNPWKMVQVKNSGWYSRICGGLLSVRHRSMMEFVLLILSGSLQPLSWLKHGALALKCSSVLDC